MSEANIITNPQILVDKGVISAEYLAKLDDKSRKFFRVPKDYLNMALADWKENAGGKMLFSPQDDGKPTILRYIVPRQWTYAPDKLIDPQSQMDWSPQALEKNAIHKYKGSGQLLLYTVSACSGFCSLVCYRKDFLDGSSGNKSSILPEIKDNYINKEVVPYIKKWNNEHPDQKINDVILSGGDPLVMSTSKLEEFIRPVAEALQGTQGATIRFGTKELAFNPKHVSTNDKLPELLKEIHEKHGTSFKFMLHFTHPSELTMNSTDSNGGRYVDKAIKKLLKTGCVSMYNQTPVVRGVNDKPEILTSLCKLLSGLGVQSYYLFHPRDTNDEEWKKHAMPVADMHEMLQKDVFPKLGGTERPREVMSTEYGKLEVISLYSDSFTASLYNLPESSRFIEFRVHRVPTIPGTEAKQQPAGIIKCVCDGKETWASDFFKEGKVISAPEGIILPHKKQLRARLPDKLEPDPKLRKIEEAIYGYVFNTAKEFSAARQPMSPYSMAEDTMGAYHETMRNENSQGLKTISEFIGNSTLSNEQKVASAAIRLADQLALREKEPLLQVTGNTAGELINACEANPAFAKHIVQSIINTKDREAPISIEHLCRKISEPRADGQSVIQHFTEQQSKLSRKR